MLHQRDKTMIDRKRDSGPARGPREPVVKSPASPPIIQGHNEADRRPDETRTIVRGSSDYPNEEERAAPKRLLGRLRDQSGMRRYGGRRA